MENNKIMTFLRRISKRLINMKIVGGENVPDEGAYIVATSHISRLDTPFLMLSTQRQDIIGFVAREYEKAPFFGWFLNKLGVIWISRDEYDHTAFREASKRLKDGWIVGIAPEGKRSKTLQLLEGKPGAALLAIRNKVQIIPAAVLGSTDLLKSFTHLKKAPIEVRFGEPFSVSDENGDNNNKDLLQQATDEIMCRIALLLPKENRGFYANHPRLLELEEEQVLTFMPEAIPNGGQL